MFVIICTRFDRVICMRREGKEGSRHHYNSILYGTVENSRRFDDYRYSSSDARHSLSRELAGLTISAVKRAVSQSSDSRPRPTFRAGKSNDSGLSGFRSSRPRTKQPRTHCCYFVWSVRFACGRNTRYRDDGAGRSIRFSGRRVGRMHSIGTGSGRRRSRVYNVLYVRRRLCTPTSRSRFPVRDRRRSADGKRRRPRVVRPADGNVFGVKVSARRRLPVADDGRFAFTARGRRQAGGKRIRDGLATRRDGGPRRSTSGMVHDRRKQCTVLERVRVK